MDESRFDRYRPRRRLESEKSEKPNGSSSDWAKDWANWFYSGGGQPTKKVNFNWTSNSTSTWHTTSSTGYADLVWASQLIEESLVSLGSDE